MPNPVVHFEIMGSDAKKTQEFYGNLFEWRIDTNNPFAYGMAYTRESGESGINGGLGSADRGNPRVSVYAQVDDPQAYLDKAVALGGTVVMGVMDIPGSVTMALFADPDGNVIGLFKK
jgi:predicted enzyme related to lactoylglutathione lyase